MRFGNIPKMHGTTLAAALVAAGRDKAKVVDALKGAKLSIRGQSDV